MTLKRFSFVSMAILGAVALSGCAETRFVTSTAKQVGAGSTQSTLGHYKVGNPYQIKDVWYYPAEDYDYVETGIASWYGPKFHGKPTANGEVFDMNQVSAAHRTLPLPSMVRVTNLENGRSLIVRVNDRGPFAHGRIIDMSKRGAQLLGFEQQGTARVKVEILRDQSLAMKNAMLNQVTADNSPIKSGAIAKPQVSAEALSVPEGVNADLQGDLMRAKSVGQSSATRSSAFVQPAQTTAASSLQTYAVDATQMFVQAGAFSQFENANRVKAQLTRVGDVEVSQVLVNGRDFFRVRLGPLQSVDEADRVLNDVIRAGYSAAKIIVVKGNG